jgi:hypothetical protein
LLRDLQARKVEKKLNKTEEQAHRAVKKKISSEWSATREIAVTDANKEINKILRRIKPPEKKSRKK